MYSVKNNLRQNRLGWKFKIPNFEQNRNFFFILTEKLLFFFYYVKFKAFFFRLKRQSWHSKKNVFSKKNCFFLFNCRSRKSEFILGRFFPHSRKCWTPTFIGHLGPPSKMFLFCPNNIKMDVQNSFIFLVYYAIYWRIQNAWILKFKRFLLLSKLRKN